jgi:hypothetical protein
VSVCLIASLWTPAGAWAAGDDGCAGARRFAQEFYDWYVTILERRDGTSWQVTKRERGAAFAAQLAQALDEDQAASAQNADEIVGLDFDPFLATQEPEDRYRAGRATRKDDRCRVEVFGLRKGKRVRSKPDVVPELEPNGDRWRFVNFHYPQGEDLLGVLKQLREDREKSK